MRLWRTHYGKTGTVVASKSDDLSLTLQRKQKSSRLGTRGELPQKKEKADDSSRPPTILLKLIMGRSVTLLCYVTLDKHDVT